MGKGNSLLYFTALQASYPATATSPYASKLVNTATVRQPDTINYIAAPGTNEWIYFTSRVPMFYNEDNGIDVYIYWTASTAAADDVIWGVAFEQLPSTTTPITGDSFAVARTVTDTGNAGGSDYMQICSISFTEAQADYLAGGVNFRMKIYRDTDDAGDDHAGIVYLHAVDLREGL